MGDRDETRTDPSDGRLNKWCHHAVSAHRHEENLTWGKGDGGTGFIGEGLIG